MLNINISSLLSLIHSYAQPPQHSTYSGWSNYDRLLVYSYTHPHNLKLKLMNRVSLHVLRTEGKPTGKKR